MLFLVTGQPGNGKTLWALVHVERLRQKDSRVVYYHGVEGLTLPWLPMPLTASGYSAKEIEKGFPAHAPDWDAVPDGAVIFIDEAHKFFPPRSSSTIARPYVQFLAEHRHRGFDVFCITQGVANIDGFLRSRVGKHFHVDRRFGVEATRLWQWERCADPTSTKDKKEGQSVRWSFPREAYGWYTSSVQHTHKRELPWRKIGVLVGAVVVAIVSVSLFVAHFRSSARGPAVLSQSSGVGSWGGSFGGSTVNGQSYWGVGRGERVRGFPESAPIYDSLQKPVTQPRVEGCAQMAVGGVIRCDCTGVNSALLDIPLEICVQFVRKGWFDETRKYDDVKAKNVAYLNSLEPGPDPVQAAAVSAPQQQSPTSSYSSVARAEAGSRGAGAARDDSDRP